MEFCQLTCGRNQMYLLESNPQSFKVPIILIDYNINCKFWYFTFKLGVKSTAAKFSFIYILSGLSILKTYKNSLYIFNSAKISNT